jgi:thermostable 8-oxoguanine DNA glycosylase
LVCCEALKEFVYDSARKVEVKVVALILDVHIIYYFLDYSVYQPNARFKDPERYIEKENRMLELKKAIKRDCQI